MKRSAEIPNILLLILHETSWEGGLPFSLSRLKSLVSPDTAEKASKHPSDEPFFCLSYFLVHIMGNPNAEFINISLNNDTQTTWGFSTLEKERERERAGLKERRKDK